LHYTLYIKSLTPLETNRINTNIYLAPKLIKKHKKLITVIKSPFVHKKSRRQYFTILFNYSINLPINLIISPFFLESLLLLLFNNNNNLVKFSALKKQVFN
jgi:hypothetical protein